MGDSPDGRYWCHMCAQVVNPIMEAELKCPSCESGFVEEMGDSGDLHAAAAATTDDLGTDRALSLWAPILLGMMGGGPRRRRLHRGDEDDELDQERGRDAEAILRRRRRSSALLQVLLGLRTGMDFDADGEREGEGERDREPVILINPFNQAIVIHGDRSALENSITDGAHGSSLGDYFIGPGLDMLLQHLADNDPNRYGTPPAKKEAVAALRTVKIEENLSCSVCLEDFSLGDEAKEMPCKHRFHSGCLLPWLELHSSCPICRLQIPAEESKDATNGSNNNNNDNNNRMESNGNRMEGNGSGDGSDSGSGSGSGSGRDDGDAGGGRRFWIPFSWPFNGIFSNSGSQGGSGSGGGGGGGGGNASSSASGSNQPAGGEN